MSIQVVDAMQAAYPSGGTSWGGIGIPLGSGYGGVSCAAPVLRLPLDLLVCVVGSSRVYASVSAGWTPITSIGAGSSFLSAFWRIADGTSLDNPNVVLSDSGSSAIGVTAFRSTQFGFDAACIKLHYENTTIGAGATYALGNQLTGAQTGELSCALGGNHGNNSVLGNYCQVSGTGWGLILMGGRYGGFNGVGVPGGCMSAYSSTLPNPAIPSVTYNDDSRSYNKFVFGAILREAPAGTTPASMLWGGM